MMEIRPKPVPRTAKVQILSIIEFRHPANDQAFLYLPKHDTLVQPDGTKKLGLHRDVALSACCIIAVNCSGFLSTSRDRQHPPAADGFLEEELLYYHLAAEGPALYPICTTFEAWPFPHSKLPDFWPNSSMQSPRSLIMADTGSALSFAVKSRDTMCLVTGSTESLSCAHIIPEAELEWFKSNNMYVYNSYRDPQRSVMNDQSNLFTLRSDVHIPQFDQKTFVVSAKDGKMVIHFIGSVACQEYVSDYHNQEISVKDVALEFLYARFAWSIIGFANKAVDIPQYFLIRQEDGTTVHGSKRKRSTKSTKKKTREKDTRTQESDASNSLTHAANDAGTTLDEAKHYEAVRREYFPMFLDEKGVVKGRLYDQLAWYPDMDKVEEMKKRWIEDHPNIRARSSLGA